MCWRPDDIWRQAFDRFGGACGEGAVMELWLRYLHEKRHIVFLYFGTVFLFVIIGTLYHFENLEKLLYATLLTFVIWGAAACWRGHRYVDKSRKLERMARHFRQSGELSLREYGEGDLSAAGEESAYRESHEDAYLGLLYLVSEEMEAQRMRWEDRTAECRDYYVMWTHQIKTPISALRLLLENGETHDRNAFLMREELFKIEQYAEMALTFQRLESISSDLMLREYGLYAMLKNAVRKYAVLFINKGLSLELQETDEKVVTDEKWFGFCVEQLLSNSIKYTPEGKITLKAAVGGTQDKVELIIEDTGMGIRPEDLPRIFEKGFTGYNGRLDKKSTGIGLYLCRKIFHHLGISVRVESQEGKGTKVLLAIPCGKRS